MSPNVIVIAPDDVGRDQLAPWNVGSLAPICPTIARACQDGVKFTRAYTQPFCSPTRAKWMTGRYGFQTGIGQLAEYQWQPLLDTEVCLPLAVKLATDYEYTCAEIGKHHLSSYTSRGGENSHSIRMGFDYFWGTLRNIEAGDTYYDWEALEARPGKRGDVWTNLTRIQKWAPAAQLDKAIEWVEEQTKPFFLYLPVNLPHSPYHRPPDGTYDADTYVLDKSAAGDADSQATRAAFYKAMLQGVDWYLSELLRRLPQEVAAQTVFLMWCDNGTPGDVIQNADVPACNNISTKVKRSVYELGVNTPLVAWGAGVAAGGRNYTGIIDSTDLFSTVLDLVGGNASAVPLPSGGTRHSTSFASVLSTPGNTTARTYAFSDLFNPNRPHLNNSLPSPQSAIVYSRYKLVRKSTGTGSPDAAIEFYDLLLDPYENTNLTPAGSTAGLSGAETTAYNLAVSDFATIQSSH